MAVGLGLRNWVWVWSCCTNELTLMFPLTVPCTASAGEGGERGCEGPLGGASSASSEQVHAEIMQLI